MLVLSSALYVFIVAFLVLIIGASAILAIVACVVRADRKRARKAFKYTIETTVRGWRFKQLKEPWSRYS